MKSNPIKILYLIAHCGQGGDWTIVKTLAGQVSSGSAEIWLNGALWNKGDSPPDGPICIHKGWRGLLEARQAGASLPADLDTIHAHSPAAILMAMRLRRLHAPSARIVFTFHWPTKDTLVRKWVKTWLFAQCARIHCYSIAINDFLQENYGVFSSRIDFNYLGVDPTRFVSITKEVKRSRREEIGWSDENLVIGYLGRFDREKNVDWLIRFMEEAVETHPHIRLLLYGGGALDNELRQQARRLIDQGRIHFAGYTTEPEKAYGLMDLHVLPSSFEAFALTVVEAALCGVPTLRTNVEGAVDQIEDGVDGFTCDIAGGYKAFRNRMVEVLESRSGDLPDIGRRSCIKLRDLCDLERFGNNMMQFYQRALE